MSLKLSLIPATAASVAPSDLLYLAKDMGGGIFLEHKLTVSVIDARYQATLGFTPVPSTQLINTTAPLTGGGDLSADRTLSMPAATGAVDGYLTAANFLIFNNKGDAQTANPLSQFAATTSAQLAGVISDETGTAGLLVFNGNPTLAGATFSAALNMGSNLINNVTNPVNPQDAATKAYVDSVAAAAAPPFLDTNALVKGSADATKLLRFEVDGFTTGTTRVLTPPNANATIAGLEVAQTFTAVQTMGANLLFSPDDTFGIGATGATRPSFVYVANSVVLQKSGIGTTPTNTLGLTNSTAAAAGAQQYSTALRFLGAGWKTNATAASQTVDWQIYNQAVEGAAAPTSNLLFNYAVNGGAYGNRLALGSNGSLLLTAPAGDNPLFRVVDTDITLPSYSSVGFSPVLATGEIFRFQNAASANGGMLFLGFTASGATTAALVFQGNSGGTAPTTAPIVFSTFKHDGGTGRSAVAAAEPSIQFNNGTTATIGIRGDGLLQFAGATSAFPAIGRNGIYLEVLAADGASTASLAIYNTKTSTTNFERLDLQWTANVAQIFTMKGSGGGTARDMVLGADMTEVLRFTSTGATYATAKTLGFRQGTNTRAGNATLVAGTVTVANTTVTANTIVMLTRKTAGGTLGTAITYTVTAATSFTITSDSALDTSTFSYVLIENPA